jgi:hypothetical protein
MKRYKVIVIAEINTEFQAETPTEALRLAEGWVSEEYGNLKHKARYEVVEIS